MNDLTDHLLAAGPELDTADDETRDRWAIDNDDLAGWALRKLAAALGETARIRATAQSEIDRIQAWAMDAERQSARDAEFFAAKLSDYRRQLEHDNPKLPKTYKLPQGSLSRRKNPDRITVTDEAAFLAWADENLPAAVNRKPLVSALKGDGFLTVIEEGNDLGVGAVVDAGTGEAVPGVAAIAGQERYEAKPAADLDGPF